MWVLAVFQNSCPSCGFSKGVHFFVKALLGWVAHLGLAPVLIGWWLCCVVLRPSMKRRIKIRRWKHPASAHCPNTPLNGLLSNTNGCETSNANPLAPPPPPMSPPSLQRKRSKLWESWAVLLPWREYCKMLDRHFGDRLDWPVVGRKLVVGGCERQYECDSLTKWGVQPQFNSQLFPGAPFTSKHWCELTWINYSCIYLKAILVQRSYEESAKK